MVLLLSFFFLISNPCCFVSVNFALKGRKYTIGNYENSSAGWRRYSESAAICLKPALTVIVTISTAASRNPSNAVDARASALRASGAGCLGRRCAESAAICRCSAAFVVRSTMKRQWRLLIGRKETFWRYWSKKIRDLGVSGVLFSSSHTLHTAWPKVIALLIAVP